MNHPPPQTPKPPQKAPPQTPKLPLKAPPQTPKLPQKAPPQTPKLVQKAQAQTPKLNQKGRNKAKDLKSSAKSITKKQPRKTATSTGSNSSSDTQDSTTPAPQFFKMRRPGTVEGKTLMDEPTDNTAVEDQVSAARHGSSMSSTQSQQSAIVDMGIADLSNEISYHGLLPREDIELLLQKNGDYMLRKSDIGGKMKIVLSVKWNSKCQHIVVRRSREGFWYLKDDLPFEDVHELLKYYKDKKVPLTPEGTRLKHPLCRQTWELSHDAIMIGNPLGEGAFGRVYKGEMRVDEKRTVPVAVKTLLNVAASKEDRQTFVKEARIMRKLRHKHIVSLFGVCAQEQPMLIVMELALNGSLLSRLKRYGHTISLGEHVRYCLDASKGMRFLENNKVIHRDVAARNCLLTDKDDVKVADFGLGMLGTATKGSGGVKLPIRWLSPETLSTAHIFTLKTDAWSFGILLWEVFADGTEPYPNMKLLEMRYAVANKRYRMEPPYGTPLIVRQVMKELWNPTPDKRPDFRYVCKQLALQYEQLKNAGVY